MIETFNHIDTALQRRDELRRMGFSVTWRKTLLHGEKQFIVEYFSVRTTTDKILKK